MQKLAHTLHRLDCGQSLIAITIMLAVPALMAAELGMPAPELKIGRWVQGQQVELKQGGDSNVYVLAFWETVCGPCRESISLLNTLQKEFARQGVVVLAISPEATSVVEQFVAATNRGEFTIASDDGGKTYNAYMKAFGETGVPHAFVIDRHGKIVWHRNPMSGLEDALREVIGGTFDLDAEKRAMASVSLQHDYLRIAQTNSSDPNLQKLGSQILKDAVQNPWLLNNFAWAILATPDIQKRDLDLATRCVKKAFDLTGGTNSAFADTYARALFDSGKTAQAVEMEKRAIELSADPRYRPFLDEALKKYQDKLKTTSP